MDTLSAKPVFWLIYFTVAFIMGYWNYRKGHNLMIGFFISVLFTPMTGLLFNIFAKKNIQVLRQREIRSAKPVPCPECGKPVPLKEFKCGNCGARIKKKKSG